MKIAGSCLLMISGYLLSIRLLEPSFYHIELLEEGEFLFRMIESEMRNSKIPLPQLFLEVGCKTESLWKSFFTDLSKELEESGDFEFASGYERLFHFYFSFVLTEEEQGMFLQMGRNLLSDDLLFHKNSLEQLSVKMQVHVEKMKEQLGNQRKVYQAVCLSMSALIIVILL